MEEIEIDLDLVTNENTEGNLTESGHMNEVSNSGKENSNRHKLVRLPLARVKTIMKKDPSCSLLSQDAVFLVTKATELFIEYLAKEAGKQLGASKRKTVMRRDIDGAIENCPELCFLDGALE